MGGGIGELDDASRQSRVCAHRVGDFVDCRPLAAAQLDHGERHAGRRRQLAGGLELVEAWIGAQHHWRLEERRGQATGWYRPGDPGTITVFRPQTLGGRASRNRKAQTPSSGQAFQLRRQRIGGIAFAECLQALVGFLELALAAQLEDTVEPCLGLQAFRCWRSGALALKPWLEALRWPPRCRPRGARLLGTLRRQASVQQTVSSPQCAPSPGPRPAPRAWSGRQPAHRRESRRHHATIRPRVSSAARRRAQGRRLQLEPALSAARGIVDVVSLDARGFRRRSAPAQAAAAGCARACGLSAVAARRRRRQATSPCAPAGACSRSPLARRSARQRGRRAALRELLRGRLQTNWPSAPGCGPVAGSS